MQREAQQRQNTETSDTPTGDPIVDFIFDSRRQEAEDSGEPLFIIDT